MTMERSSAGTVSLRCRLNCFTILFSDGYINGLIGTAITILTREYPESKFGMQYYSKLLGSITLAGTVFGMLVFGCTSDRLLRMSFAVSVALLLSMSCGTWGFVFGNNDIATVVDWLCVWRFLLGIGVGAGNTSATVSLLGQTEKKGIPENAQNWWLVLATNSLIDIGFVTSMFVPFLLSCIFDGKHLNVVWGLSACLSVIPICLWCHPPKWDDAWEHVHIPYWLALKRYWKSLLGLSLAWFIYDFIMYPLVIYSSMIMDIVTGGSSSLVIVFGWALFINLFYILGSVLGVFLVDERGLKNLMIVGLLMQAIVGLGIGAMHDVVTKHIAAYAIAYGVFLGLGEFGPGNCICVLAAKTAPLAVCEQFYGTACVIGKVGALIGIWAFPQIIDAFGSSNIAEGITAPFWIGGGLAVVSTLMTFCLVKPIPHNSMKAEDEAFRQYLAKNGFDVGTL
ncbi:major facilitator superfamily domain-containing protein [Pisolithus albus]|nr:major facilitator superfamily domain-containing protein [Pisolithus albus]